MKHGIVQIYTGDGKGKTTAAAGLAVRALSRRLRVCWVSFFKDPDKTGHAETALLRKWGADVFNFVPKHTYFDKKIKRTEMRSGCLKALGLVSEIFKKNYDVIILDEINIALHGGFLKDEEVLLLLRHKPRSAEVVLTGRGATPGLIKAASLVTEMKKIKHPFDKGFKARPGIEY